MQTKPKKETKIGALLSDKGTPYVKPQPVVEEEIEFQEPEMPTNPLLEELQQLHEWLKGFDEYAPMTSQLESWKNRHNNIYISKVVDEKKYYIWRTITRQEYKVLSHNKAMEDENSAQEIIVEKCLLYPIPDIEWRLKSDAGVIATLSKQISYQSGFISAQEAVAFVKVI